MKLKNIARLCLFGLTASVVSVAQIGVLPKKDFTLKLVRDSKFHVGDVWEYQTRPGEEHSLLTITRVDESPELGIIVHVSADRVRLVNCHGGNEPDNIQHMPFARKALDASIKNKVARKKQVSADYDQAYEEWRSAYVKNKAGIYVVSVADAVDIAETTFREGIGCP